MLLSKYAASLRRAPIAVFLGLAFLAMGCTSIETLESPYSDFDTTTGHVAGMFSGRGGVVGLTLVNRQTEKEYVLRLFKPNIVISEGKEVVSMIQVPPGDYRISRWATYEAITHTTNTATDFPDRGGNYDFIVGKGRVVFIGRFGANEEYTHPDGVLGGVTTEYSLKPRKVKERQILAAFKKHYPLVPPTAIDY